MVPDLRSRAQGSSRNRNTVERERVREGGSESESMASSSSSRSGKAGAGGFDHLFKILLVGDSGVGKSSILMRFTTEDCFDDMSPTIGVDFKLKMFDVEGKKLKVRNVAMISLLTPLH